MDEKIKLNVILPQDLPKGAIVQFDITACKSDDESIISSIEEFWDEVFPDHAIRIVTRGIEIKVLK